MINMQINLIFILNQQNLQKSWFSAHKFCASYAMQVLDLAAHLEQNNTLLQMFLSAKGYQRT
jgi:hypothetical protein